MDEFISFILLSMVGRYIATACALKERKKLYFSVFYLSIVLDAP